MRLLRHVHSQRPDALRNFLQPARFSHFQLLFQLLSHLKTHLANISWSSGLDYSFQKSQSLQNMQRVGECAFADAQALAMHIVTVQWQFLFIFFKFGSRTTTATATATEPQPRACAYTFPPSFAHNLRDAVTPLVGVLREIQPDELTPEAWFDIAKKLIAPIVRAGSRPAFPLVDYKGRVGHVNVGELEGWRMQRHAQHRNSDEWSGPRVAHTQTMCRQMAFAWVKDALLTPEYVTNLMQLLAAQKTAGGLNGLCFEIGLLFDRDLAYGSDDAPIHLSKKAAKSFLDDFEERHLLVIFRYLRSLILFALSFRPPSPPWCSFDAAARFSAAKRDIVRDGRLQRAVVALFTHVL